MVAQRELFEEYMEVLMQLLKVGVEATVGASRAVNSAARQLGQQGRSARQMSQQQGRSARAGSDAPRHYPDKAGSGFAGSKAKVATTNDAEQGSEAREEISSTVPKWDSRTSERTGSSSAPGRQSTSLGGDGSQYEPFVRPNVHRDVVENVPRDILVDIDGRFADTYARSAHPAWALQVDDVISVLHQGQIWQAVITEHSMMEGVGAYQLLQSEGKTVGEPVEFSTQGTDFEYQFEYRPLQRLSETARAEYLYGHAEPVNAGELAGFDKQVTVVVNERVGTMQGALAESGESFVDAYVLFSDTARIERVQLPVEQTVVHIQNDEHNLYPVAQGSLDQVRQSMGTDAVSAEGSGSATVVDVESPEVDVRIVRDALKPPTFVAGSEQEWASYIPVYGESAGQVLGYVNQDSPLVNTIFEYPADADYQSFIDVGGQYQVQTVVDDQGSVSGQLMEFGQQTAAVLSDQGWYVADAQDTEIDVNQPVFVAGGEVRIGPSVPEVVVAGGAVDVSDPQNTNVRVLSCGVVNGQSVNHFVKQAAEPAPVAERSEQAQFTPAQFTMADMNAVTMDDDYGMSY